MGRFLYVMVMLLLAGCTTPLVQADVTRFHGLAATQARSFTITPEQGQGGSLEFQRYAEMVAAALAAQGWRPVAPGGQADTLVTLHWGIGQPSTTVWQSPSTFYGGYGWGATGHWYGAGTAFPFYEPYPYWETHSVTTYPKWLSVEIAEARTKIRLFEGRAVAEGSRRELAPVMPYLIRALFTGFPGTSGTTVRVEIPIAER